MSKHSHAYCWLFIASVCVLRYAEGPSLSIVIVPVDKIASEKNPSQLNKLRDTERSSIFEVVMEPPVVLQIYISMAIINIYLF